MNVTKCLMKGCLAFGKIGMCAHSLTPEIPLPSDSARKDLDARITAGLQSSPMGEPRAADTDKSAHVPVVPVPPNDMFWDLDSSGAIGMAMVARSIERRERARIVTLIESQLVDESGGYATAEPEGSLSHTIATARDLGYRAGHNDRARSLIATLKEWSK